MSLLANGCNGNVAATPTVETIQQTSVSINPTSTSTVRPTRSSPTNTQTPTPTFTKTATATASDTRIPSPTSTTTSTPTPSFTPSNNPTYTPSAIPETLDTLPLEFPTTDISIVDGNFVFQVTSVSNSQKIGVYEPRNDYHYLVIRGHLYNYGDEEQEFHDVDFSIDLINEKGLIPDVKVMAEFQKNVYLNAGYPDRNLPFYPNFVVAAKKAKETILIYETPQNVDFIKLYFSPVNTNPKPNLGILLIPSGTFEYLFFKESLNGELQYIIDFEENVIEVEEIIDSEEVDVDNCFGTTTITRSFEFSVETQSFLDAGFTPRLPLISNLFEGYVRQIHQESNQDQTKISSTRTEALSAAPGTKPSWQLNWYQVSVEGVITVQLGGQNFKYPYKLSNRLRSELVSIPSEGCEEKP